MNQVIEHINELFQQYSQEPVDSIEKLPQAGSERYYFRIRTATSSYIATYGANIKENDVFIYFSDHFQISALLQHLNS